MSQATSILLPDQGQMAVRLLNRDSADMVVERLGSEVIMVLSAWHVDPMGCDGGKRLLEQAPLFDTYLEECLSSDFLAAKGARSQAYFLFGMGLWLGGHYRALAERGPWETNVSLDDVFDRLSALDNDELPAAGLTQALIEEVVRISEKLITLSAGVDRVVFASMRMTMCSIGAPGEISGALRFLFTLGLVGSGITPPWDEDQCCAEAAADVQTIDRSEVTEGGTGSDPVEVAKRAMTDSTEANEENE